ncbi:MAG: hypothetical protein AVDCRST_MAG76-577, partial [uncultured Acidimicrobiales bacterium]
WVRRRSSGARSTATSTGSDPLRRPRSMPRWPGYGSRPGSRS